jgi:hypothetical protein
LCFSDFIKVHPLSFPMSFYIWHLDMCCRCTLVCYSLFILIGESVLCYSAVLHHFSYSIFAMFSLKCYFSKCNWGMLFGLQKLECSKPVIVAGDLNCARQSIDIHNPQVSTTFEHATVLFIWSSCYG